MSKKYSKELNYVSKSTLLYMLKDISNCLIEQHNFDYDTITMYIDRCYMSSDEFIKKYFSNERPEFKSFIKKTYNRKTTMDDIKELFKEILD